jgi:glycosyltransferase involved in cell wall biosynthesis
LTKHPDPFKLLYLITDLSLGGAQKVLTYIIEHLDRNWFRPLVACLYGGDSPIGDDLRNMGIPVYDLKMNKKWRLDSLWRLYKLLHTKDITILHSSLFHANMAARLVGTLAHTPIIITWRQNINIGSNFRDFTNKLTSSLDDHVVAVSENTRLIELQASGVPPNKVSVVHNCIDVARYELTKSLDRNIIRAGLDIPKDAFLLGVVGRLHPQKGLFFLLDALLKIKNSIEQVELLIIGEGALRYDLEAHADSIGVSGITKFTGPRTDIPEILRALDVFVLPSLWEGLPLALLEAMASGLPVIATDVGGIPEVVINRETGLLIQPSNSQAIADAVLLLFNDRNLRIRLANAGSAFVYAQFSAQTLVKEMETVYKHLLAQKKII